MFQVPTATFTADKKISGARKYWLLGTLTALLILAAGIVVWRIGGNNGLQYTTAPVTHGPVTLSVSATGTVNPELTVIVGTYVSGVIQSLSCDYNTQVQAGQVCAKIDPRPFQATLEQYTGQLQRDRAMLAKDQANLKRYESLAARNSIARQQADDQAYIVQQDEGTVKLDQGLVESARLNLGYTDIVSPVNGTVVSRNVTQGQTVAASFQTPTLFLIASDLKKMQVDANVSESDIGGIEVGDDATFVVDAFPKRTFHAKVHQVRQSPQTVQNVVTYDVVLSVDNSDLALKPGMTATAQIVVDKRNDVIRLPDEALRFVPKDQTGSIAQPGGVPTPSEANANRGQVWILRQGQPIAVPVLRGLDDGTYTEIVRGALQPGDQVITGEQRTKRQSSIPSFPR